MQQVAVRWQSKTPRGKVAWCAGTTIGLLGYPVRAYEQSVLVCGSIQLEMNPEMSAKQ